jgi:hypothetical protein
LVLAREPGLVLELALAVVLVLELVVGLVLALVLVPELVLELVLELELELELELVLELVLELAAEEEELGLEAVDCSALVGAIPNIHPHSMVKKVARLFELRWMEAAMWLMQLQKAAAAKSMKLR